jgi:peptide methionine sulfoxide reductase msrA/msrB
VKISRVIGLTFVLMMGGLAMTDSAPQTQKATFAGGCFWCMQPPFEQLKGVVSVKAGYTGGKKENPSYEEVSSGSTGHAEAVEVIFDPSKISYNELLDTFWQNVDPTAVNAQFADHGTQYRTAIFYHSEEQKKEAEASRDRLSKSGKFHRPIVTQIVPATPFYYAEDYHQDYAKKNPLHYNAYKVGSGRESFIERTWGKKK